MSINFWKGDWRGTIPYGNDHQRSREVIRHTGNIVRVKFVSRKNGRMVHNEGLLELDASYLFEMSPRIVRYGEQAEQIHYPDGAKLRRYTPDFELVLVTGETILVEVKPSRNLEKAETRHKFHCISEYFARCGKPFVILTEEKLRSEPRQANLRWLYHQMPRVAPTGDAMRVCLDRHWKQFPMPIKDTVPLLRKSGIHPFSLLVNGLLTCPLDQTITHDTHLHINEESDNGWFFIEKKHGF
jgi:TnsA endonuclease N terminal